MNIRENAITIRTSAMELSIDEFKDAETQQRNAEERERVIGCIDLFIDRELFCVEQEISDIFEKDIPEDEAEENSPDGKTEEDCGGVCNSCFYEFIDDLNHSLEAVDTLVKARAYLEARNQGILGIK